VRTLIGLPGETVLIQHGQVFVDGQPLHEPYVQVWATYDFPPDGTAQLVPDHSYFVLGDNRPNSRDSHLGWFVRADDLVGRVWLRYWPTTELALLTGGQVQTDPRWP
jgi:signal peptidase I